MNNSNEDAPAQSDLETSIANSLREVLLTTLGSGLRFLLEAVESGPNSSRIQGGGGVPEGFDWRPGEIVVQNPQLAWAYRDSLMRLDGSLSSLGLRGGVFSDADLVRVDVLRYLLEIICGTRLDFLGEKRVTANVGYYQGQLEKLRREVPSLEQQQEQIRRQQVAQQQQEQVWQQRQDVQQQQGQDWQRQQRQDVQQQQGQVWQQRQDVQQQQEQYRLDSSDVPRIYSGVHWQNQEPPTRGLNFGANVAEEVRSFSLEAEGTFATVRSEAADEPLIAPPLPQEEQRYLVGRMVDQAQVGQTLPVSVRLALQAGGGVSVPTRPLRVAPEGTDVTLDIYCPGFRSISNITQQVRIFPGQDSDPVRFEIQALKEGNFRVEVTAYSQGAFLGTIPFPLTISAAEVRAEQPVERTATLEMRSAHEGEVTLDIAYDPLQNCYRFQLRSEVLGVLEPMFSEAFVGSNRDAKVVAFVKAMNEQARARNDYSPSTTRRWLKGMGTTLWDELLPQPLKEVFWNRQGDFKRLNIVSAGDPMPWEMLYPFKQGATDEGFLAERMTVTRWRYGTPPSPKTGTAPPLYILPGDAPSSATNEVAKVQAQIGQGQLIRELDPLLDQLDGGDFGLLHFASHNVSQAAQTDSLIASYIPLNGQKFTQMFLGPQFEGRFSARAPLVFVNACCSDAMAPSYTNLTGWAHCFLGAGAGAFVGSLWEVRDRAASQFAEAFYGALKQNKTLGEAMKEGRDSISSNTQGSTSTDPTWLAYTLYGDPDATIKSLT